MVFTETHWEELTRQGYTIVSDAIDDHWLRPGPGRRKPSECHPSGPGLGEIQNELWREIRH